MLSNVIFLALTLVFELTEMIFEFARVESEKWRFVIVMSAAAAVIIATEVVTFQKVLSVKRALSMC